ncbi:MAG: serine/threonine-protein kinase [Gemmatimonadota bacterium]|nr:serine/threonine-protein kinase [Gemmatimonadota bacterium]
MQEEVATLDLSEPAGSRRIPRDEEVLGLLQAAARPDYEILGELGRGGMATVYLAREIALDRKVAIKVLSPALVYGRGMVERFKREARTAGGLSHPHIIPIHAVRETPDLLFIVMKYVEGRPLDSVLAEMGALPIRMAQTILTQVASALYTAHRRQVIHRDIKSANIMLDEEGYAVVTDFGIAKVNTEASLTQTGSAVGTPYYMSPEQFVGQGVGPASDQYSLGVVGYEMLTGRVPFPARSLQEVMRSHLIEPPTPVRQLRHDCPPALARAILRMLSKMPEERFPSMEDVVQTIGTAPLETEEAVRTQIIELARSGKQHRHIPARTGTPSGSRPASSTSKRGLPVVPPRHSVERARHPTPSGARPALPRSPSSSSARPVVPNNPTPAGSRQTISRPAPRRPALLRWLAAGVGALAAVGLGWLVVVLVLQRPKANTHSQISPGASVSLASSFPDTKLVINGRDTVPLGIAVRTIPVPAGSLRLRAVRPGCRPMDTTLTLRQGDAPNLGRFDPRCR